MRFRWGIFGTGAISAKFVSGLAAAREAEAGFVASRSEKKAKAFASAMGIPRAVEGYAEAAASGGVDAIYIATPPSEHVAHALLCLEAGIPVLIEKPMATNARDAARIEAAARANSLFAMEAMWTRFLPAARALKDAVAARPAGDIRIVSGNFGVSQVRRSSNGIFDPALGGGALSHLAPYPLSIAQWLFGSPEQEHALGTIGSTGVDESVVFQLRYPGNVLGSFHVSIRAWAPDTFHVEGSTGMLAFSGSLVRPFGLRTVEEPAVANEQLQFGWKSRLRQHGVTHMLAQRLGRSSRGQGRSTDHFYAGNGYHYQADEVRACIERGAIESEIMPLRDSLAVIASIDRLRAAIQTPGTSS